MLGVMLTPVALLAEKSPVTGSVKGSLPLTAYYFHLFSPVTLLANLVIVPLSSFALMEG